MHIKIVDVQPVHSEGGQLWDFFGRNDAKAEAPVLWPPHEKSWPIGKDSDAGRDWGQEEKGMTEDEMPGWHHGLDGRKSEWTLGDGDGQGGLACCDSQGRKESDTTERLNWLAAALNRKGSSKTPWCFIMQVRTGMRMYTLAHESRKWVGFGTQETRARIHTLLCD